jgi:uncharacterized damage-inducible protein DinB
MNTPPIATQLHAILLRDVRALRREIEAYPDDDSLWAVPGGISNSGGTLVLHLVGNLRTYVGQVLGGDGYERDRPREFSARGLTRAELLRDLDLTLAAVDRALPLLTADVLAAEYPLAIGAVRVNAQDFLLHVAVHLGYHLGQVDYHRRMVTQSPATVSAVSPAELNSAKPVAPA